MKCARTNPMLLKDVSTVIRTSAKLVVRYVYVKRCIDWDQNFYQACSKVCIC